MLRTIFNIFIFYSLFILNSFSEELKITSDKLEIDRSNKISIFTGNVYLYNKDLKLWGEKLTVFFNEEDDEIKEIQAEKNVKIIKQEITAFGDKGFYIPQLNVVNLRGNVEVQENKNYVKCDELVLDIKNSTSIMKSASSNRVEAFINN